MQDDAHYRKVEIHALARTVTDGRQRMWVGVFDRNLPDHLSWTIETSTGHTVNVQAETVRELDEMTQGPPVTKTHSGVYDLILPPGVPPDDPEAAQPANVSGRPTSYTVRAYAFWTKGNRTSRSNRLNVRPLPAAMPTDFGTSFKVLLVSCFFEGHDTTGQAGAAVQRLTRGPERPDLVLTVGDQVYLDNPWFKSMFPAIQTNTYARKFEEKYRKNWQTPAGGVATSYANILRAAPVAAIPDDLLEQPPSQWIAVVGDVRPRG